MSKRRKTKQQKIIADLQRKLQSTSPSISQAADQPSQITHKPMAYTLKLPTNHIERPTTTLTAQTPFFLKDLKKTMVLTSAVVLFQLFLFYMLRHHFVVIPGMTY